MDRGVALKGHVMVASNRAIPRRCGSIVPLASARLAGCHRFGSSLADSRLLW